MKKPLLALACLVAISALLMAEAPKTKKLDVKRSAGTKASASASSTYTMFPYPNTITGTNKIQIPGCSCGTNKVTVSPTSVITKVNTPVQIRYDASPICNKQTIRDLSGNLHPYVDGADDNSQVGSLTLGTVQWEVGAVSDLPLEWGIITYDTGYVQPTSEQIQISIKVQCFDSGPKCTAPGHYQVCEAQSTIPVTVTP